MRFLNGCCQLWLDGNNRYARPLRTLFHTSHPGLAAALRRDPKWTQVSAQLYGGSKVRSSASLRKTMGADAGSGFGGHLRAVQGFRYLGEGV